jgi:hypothetical protein
VAAKGRLVAVHGRSLEAAGGEVVAKPSLAEGGEGELLGLSVALSLDVDESPPQLGLGPPSAPGRLLAEGLEHTPA